MSKWTQSSSCDSNACLQWMKSSHSAGNGACLEWRKSSYSLLGECVEFHKSSFSSNNGSCVETSNCTCEGTNILVRDSKDKSGPVLTFTPAEWEAFVKGVKAGEFDL